MRRLGDESGFVGGFEAIPFGFLVFVVGTLLLVNAWAVFDSHMAASAAAREAVRVFVESDGPDSDARLRGQGAAVATLEGQGKQESRMHLSWRNGQLVRCQAVTVTVTYDVPTISLPWIGGWGSVIATSAHHTEIVDPYRAGLDTDGFDPGACRA
ncbi:MAG: hypothetical protein JWM47_1968 [Acidimicrobiales bacterium]|nr:hypothetical protein [Acidimicrobiales bacterium]